MSKGIVTPLITIGLNAERKLTIVGPLENKAECVLILADALKLVAVHENKEKPKIVTPQKDIIVPGRG
jgi:hypothetical protein